MIHMSEKKTNWKLFLKQALVSAIISSSVVGVVMKWGIDKNLEEFKSIRQWKEYSLRQVVAPVVINLNRSKNAFTRYKANKRYSNVRVLIEVNTKVRDILLENSQFLPDNLYFHAQCLISHYDTWEKNFNSLPKDITDDTRVDIGTVFSFDGHCAEFPEESEAAFQRELKKLRYELYSIE